MSSPINSPSVASHSNNYSNPPIGESTLIKEILLYRGMVRTAMVFSDELHASQHQRSYAISSANSTINSAAGTPILNSSQPPSLVSAQSSGGTFVSGIPSDSSDPRGTLAGATPYSLVDMFRKFLRKPDLEAAINLWDMFEEVFLSRADSPTFGFFQKGCELKLSLYKLFLVAASKISASSPEIIKSFYQKLKFGIRIGRGMQDCAALFGGGGPISSFFNEFYEVNEKEMDVAKKLPNGFKSEPPVLGSEWLTLPYIPDPSNHPFFELYFTKDWEEMFFLSLYNFFEKVFSSCPLPRLLAFNLSRCEISSLRSQVKCLQDEVELLRSRLSDASCRLPVEILKSSIQRTEFAVHNLPLFQATEKHFAATSAENNSDMKEWTVSNLKAVDIGSHLDRITSLLFSKDAKYLCTSSRDAVLKVWDIESFLNHSLRGSSDLLWNSAYQTCLLDSPITCSEWLQSSKNPSILLGTEDGKVRLWNCDSRSIDFEFVADPNRIVNQDLFNHECPITSISCNPREHYIAVSCGSTQFKSIGSRSGSRTPSVSHLSQEYQSGSVSVWSLQTLQWKNFFELEDENLSHTCTALSYNSTGSLLVIALLNGAIQLIGFRKDTHSFSLGAAWMAHEGHFIHSVKFSEDDGHVISLGSDNIVRIWSLTMSNRLIKEINLANTSLCQNFVLPRQKDRVMLISDSPQTFSVFSNIDGRKLKTIENGLRDHSLSTAPIYFDWNPSHKILAQATSDNCLYLLNNFQ